LNLLWEIRFPRTISIDLGHEGLAMRVAQLALLQNNVPLRISPLQEMMNRY